MRYGQADDKQTTSYPKLDLTAGQNSVNKIMYIFTKVRAYLTTIVFQCKCVFILFFHFVFNNFKREMSASCFYFGGKEMNACTLLYFAKIWGLGLYMYTRDRRLWIWIRMEKFISTASLLTNVRSKFAIMSILSRCQPTVVCQVSLFCA